MSNVTSSQQASPSNRVSPSRHLPSSYPILMFLWNLPCLRIMLLIVLSTSRSSVLLSWIRAPEGRVCVPWAMPRAWSGARHRQELRGDLVLGSPAVAQVLHHEEQKMLAISQLGWIMLLLITNKLHMALHIINIQHGQTFAIGTMLSRFLSRCSHSDAGERMLTFAMTSSEGEVGFAWFFSHQFCEAFT